MHILGRCIGGNVEVFRVAVQQQVSDSAADKIGLMTLPAKTGHYLQGTVADMFTGNAVLVSGNDFQKAVRL